jgi:IBR domain, a half RING-finger domain
MARFGGTRKIKGRVVQAKLGPAPDYWIRQPIWSVELGNLDVHTSKADLVSALRGVTPDKAVFGKPSHSMSETEACTLVEAHLREYGPLESFETSHGLNANRMKALARFKSAVDAQDAVSQLSARNLSMSGRHGNIKLFLNLTASVKFLVLAPLYEIISRDIEKSQSESESVRINAYPPDRDGKPVVIRIIGQDLPAVSKAKTVFERLIKGDIILNENGSPCWDDYFVSLAGLEYVKALSQPGRTFVYRDARKCQLTMHGSTQAFEGTRQAILVKLKELSEMTHVLQLTPILRSRAFNGAFRVMVETLGRSIVKLDVTTKPPSIVVKGNMSVFARAHSLLHSPLEGQSSPKNIPCTDAECPVCMMDPDDAVSLRCNHSYCEDCFEEQCKAADSLTIPLRCFGEYAKCGRTISLQDLKVNLPSEAFEALLNASFDAYLQKHPETYQYCPSPDCPTIYAITTDGTTKSCPTCMTTICTTCQTVNHDGITCEESRYMVSDDYKAFNEWKRSNDVRDCPCCKTAIEKRDGCNHMECGGCHAHICWFCMDVFKLASQCYTHMHEKHKGIYRVGF